MLKSYSCVILLSVKTLNASHPCSSYTQTVSIWSYMEVLWYLIVQNIRKALHSQSFNWILLSFHPLHDLSLGTDHQLLTYNRSGWDLWYPCHPFSHIPPNPPRFPGAGQTRSLSLETEKNRACLLQSLIIHVSRPCCSQVSAPSHNDCGVNFSGAASLCLRFMSRVRATEAWSAPGAEQQPARPLRSGGRTELRPSSCAGERGSKEVMRALLHYRRQL